MWSARVAIEINSADDVQIIKYYRQTWCILFVEIDLPAPQSNFLGQSWHFINQMFVMPDMAVLYSCLRCVVDWILSHSCLILSAFLNIYDTGKYPVNNTTIRSSCLFGAVTELFEDVCLNSSICFCVVKKLQFSFSFGYFESLAISQLPS